MHSSVNSEEVSPSAPRVVIFEGVDGTGKTTFARALGRYYRQLFPAATVLEEAFPGSRSGTLGNWVYRLHHADTNSSLDPRAIAPAALQLLHVAAHVDAIVTRFTPALTESGSFLILDRYWWSTYAYARLHLAPDQALALVYPEQLFWKPLPPPRLIYFSRHQSLKSHEIDSVQHKRIDSHYREIIDKERQDGVIIHEINNNGDESETWVVLLRNLGLPMVDYADFSSTAA